MLMVRRTHKRLILTMLAIGYGFGAAAGVQLMYSTQNSARDTVFRTPFFIVAVAMIMSSQWFLRLIEDFERATKSS